MQDAIQRGRAELFHQEFLGRFMTMKSKQEHILLHSLLLYSGADPGRPMRAPLFCPEKNLEVQLRVLSPQRITRSRMNRRFYVIATVALLLAGIYSGTHRSTDAAPPAPARAADATPVQQLPTPVTARSAPSAPPATPPRS
jgi:hypothetical protein